MASHSSQLILYTGPTTLSFPTGSFGCTNSCCKVFEDLKYVGTPNPPKILFSSSENPLMYGTTTGLFFLSSLFTPDVKTFSLVFSLTSSLVSANNQISCEECDATYVGETERSLKARFGEHKRPSSTTSEVSKHIHTDNPNHNITLENTKILSVEHKWFERGVKEAIYIRAMNPSLNRDGGRYNLPPVWNNIIKERATDGAGTTNGGGARPEEFC